MQFQIRQMGASRCFVLITEPEYQAIVEARRGLRELLGVEQKFDVVLENHVELEEAVFHESLQQMAFREWDEVFFLQRMHHISRRILNLLASCRLYLDALPQHVGAVFGQESALRAEIRAATSREYDRSLAFRAMEALRNYAQHSDLPVHGAVADSGWDVAADRLAFSFVPQLRKIQLTKDRKFIPARKPFGSRGIRRMLKFLRGRASWTIARHRRLRSGRHFRTPEKCHPQT